MQITNTNPTDFISGLPEPERSDVAKLDQEIGKITQGMKRVMWEGVFWGGSQQKIIGYGNFTYTRSDKKTGDWFVIGLALQKNYIALHVVSVAAGQYITEKYKDQLGKAKVGRSTITFKKLADIKLDKLLEVVQKAIDNVGSV